LDVLQTIKRLVVRGNLLFTQKAEEEMERDDLDEDLVAEAILNAPGIAKRLRSTNPETGQREYLYVIVGVTFDGLALYTKGKILKKDGREVFYVLVSSKKSTVWAISPGNCLAFAVPAVWRGNLGSLPGRLHSA
jgi:hypothetical protein